MDPAPLLTIDIGDAEDPRVDDFRRLTDGELRRRDEVYIAESFPVVQRALDAGHEVVSVLAQRKWLPKIEALGLPEGTPVLLVSAELAERVTGYAVHRGALAVMRRPPLREVPALLDGARRILILDDLKDPTNVGAIFRNAAALGTDAVLVTPGCADPLYRRAIRVSMGAVFQVPWTRTGEWPELAEQLRAAGFRTVALALADESVPIDEFSRSAPERLALCLGNEGEGLGSEALASADAIVRIPMRPGVDSLNVAAASAVALWELR